MNDLKRFYTTWLRIVTVAIGFLCAYVAVYFPKIIAQILVSGGTLALLFLIAEWFIREKMWRWSMFYRSLDFEGKWSCVTYYEDLETRNEEHRTSFKPYPAQHDAVIEQNTQQIRISSSQGREYKGWESIMMDIAPTGIVYAYTVEYAATSEMKGKPIGYENMSVQQRKPDVKSGKPILLVGTFAHCAAGQEKAFRGTAVFCRSDSLDDIEVKAATDPHVKEAIGIIQNEQKKS